MPALTRTVVLDLSDPVAGAALAEATADLEVGMLVYNAGADSHANARSPFCEAKKIAPRTRPERDFSISGVICSGFRSSSTSPSSSTASSGRSSSGADDRFVKSNNFVEWSSS